MNQMFVDGFDQIAVIQGNVRVGLKTFSLNKKDDEGHPILEDNGHLIMGVQQFLNLHAAMGDLIKQLEEKDVIRKKDDVEKSAD